MKMILIVEDDEYIREIIRITLQSEKFLIIEAENGKKALELAICHHPDLIISDVMMPVMDGFELLENIREEKMTRNIPFILLTGLETPAAKRLGEELGADAFIVKPFILTEFLYTVRNLLAKKQRVA